LASVGSLGLTSDAEQEGRGDFEEEQAQSGGILKKAKINTGRQLKRERREIRNLYVDTQ
jgi:hypothetical protein